MHPEIKTILYATDMGEHMRPVFRFAIEMAKKHEAKIIMLHAAEPLTSGVQMAINVYMPDTTARSLPPSKASATSRVLCEAMKNS